MHPAPEKFFADAHFMDFNSESFMRQMILANANFSERQQVPSRLQEMFDFQKYFVLVV